MRWPALLLLATAINASPIAAQDHDTSRPFRVTDWTFMAIVVRDVGAQADWYRATFGLREANRLVADDGRYDIRVLSGPALVVELLALGDADQPPTRHFGLFKAGMMVDDILAAHDWLRRRGVDVDDQVFTDDALAMQSFTFRDPEGNRLQFFREMDP